MKKALCMIALAAISVGAVTAAPVKMAQDTMKMKDTSKMRMKHKKMHMKKKMKDTTGMSKM